VKQISLSRVLVFAFTSAVLFGLFPPKTSAESFSGPARAIDGDSLMVGDREVRLHGIDAPEFTQVCQKSGQPWRCGEEAARRLSALIEGRRVDCDPVDTDEHGRIVASCSTGNMDINRAMVASGYAVAYRHYSLAYVSAEDSAKANRRGLWAGTFEMPREYRRADKPPGASSAPRKSKGSGPKVVSFRSSPQPSSGCVIRGNRGSNGWIYHVPGMPYYAQTRAEEMFCTEAEARAAGYRRAKVR
jgi:endonuclease YncB( thermonuclease family)